MNMIVFNPMTGETKDPETLNEADKTTYDACLGAIALLTEQAKQIEQLYDYVLKRGNGREIQKKEIDTAFGIVEDVLDDLIEVGNGTTDEALHADADKLFGLRYFLVWLFRPDRLEYGEHKYDKKKWEMTKMEDGTTEANSRTNKNDRYKMSKNTETTPTLKSCPFCGAKAVLWKWGMGAHTVIECANYDVDIHRVSVQGDTEAEAVEAWNRRAGNG